MLNETKHHHTIFSSELGYADFSKNCIIGERTLIRRVMLCQKHPDPEGE